MCCAALVWYETEGLSKDFFFFLDQKYLARKACREVENKQNGTLLPLERQAVVQ